MLVSKIMRKKGGSAITMKPQDGVETAIRVFKEKKIRSNVGLRANRGPRRHSYRARRPPRHGHAWGRDPQLGIRGDHVSGPYLQDG